MGNLARRAVSLLTISFFLVPTVALPVLTVSALLFPVDALARDDDDDGGWRARLAAKKAAREAELREKLAAAKKDDDDDDGGKRVSKKKKKKHDDDDDDDGGGGGPVRQCKHYSEERLPFFGETHLHTGLSFDATLRFTRATPREAFAFAKGEGIIFGADEAGFRDQLYRIDRPIDWGAVTDHSEYFGELGICTSPNAKGRFSLDCKLLLGFGYQPGSLPPEFQRELASAGFNVVDFPTIIPISRATQMPLCTADASAEYACAKSELRVWDQVQAAADEANDRSSDCKFTAFRAYENTSTPNATNWHRNVIFKNEHTIPIPISAVDLSQEENPDPRKIPPVYRQAGGPDLNKLFDGLQEQCLDAGTGCDVIVIPHNSNVGPEVRDVNGDVLTPSQWHDPADAEEAAKWRRFQPLVEIHQIKGTSECRWDPRFGEGVDTKDEDCAFELLNSTSLSAAAGAGSGGVGTPEDTDPRTFVRNVLKAGLDIQDKYGGINPFKVGFVGATDNHNGTMSWTPENETYFGHEGIEDYQPMRKINSTQNNTGGLGVAWAEQNTRESIFEALKRRETYATSGIRPIVRFFGGWNFDLDSCAGNFVEAGYRDGVPMGGDLPDRPAGASPNFILSAVADDFVGDGRPQATPLQQIQIIKGWLDSDSGETREAVYSVAGAPNNGAGVDDECGLTGGGFESLCTVWRDPDFRPDQRAFYYARVIENPVCRYSTLICQNRFSHPVNVLEGQDTCLEQLADLPEDEREDAANCCTETVPDDPTSDLLQPVIQERAWTSPIYYTP